MFKAIPFRQGNWYETLGGDWVKCVAIVAEGRPHQTWVDQHGVHRYCNEEYLIGRCTGTAHDYSDPRNTPPVFKFINKVK